MKPRRLGAATLALLIALTAAAVGDAAAAGEGTHRFAERGGGEAGLAGEERDARRRRARERFENATPEERRRLREQLALRRGARRARRGERAVSARRRARERRRSRAPAARASSRW